MLFRALSCLHLGVGTLNREQHESNVSKLLDSFEDNRADITVFLGDTFHHYNVASGRFPTHYLLDLFNRILDCAEATSSEVIVIMGNHDSKDGFFLPGYKARIFTKPTVLNDLKVVVWPWQYDSEAAESARANLFNNTDLIFFGHVALSDIPVFADVRITSGINTFSLLELGAFHQAIIGHYHFRETRDTVSYVGQPWNTRFAPSKEIERRAVPGYALYDPEFVGPKWVDLNTTRFLTADTPEEYYKADNVVWRLRYKAEKSDDVAVIVLPPDTTEANTSVLDEIGDPKRLWDKWGNDPEGWNILKELGINVESIDRKQSLLENITKVVLHNVAVHEDFEYEFGSKTAIIGKFGAGKSYVIESILLALYGQTPRGPFSQLIQHGKNTAWVIVEMIVDGKKVEIKRAVKKSKRVKTVFEVVVNGEKQPDPNGWIEHNLGTREFVQATWFVHQERLGSLSYLKPSDRVNFLHKLMGLDRYSDTYDALKKHKNRLESELKASEKMIETTKEALEKIPPRDELEKAKTTLELGRIADANKAAEIKRKMREVKDEFDWLTKAIETVKTYELDKFDLSVPIRLSALQSELKNLQDKIQFIKPFVEIFSGFEKGYKKDYCNECPLYKIAKERAVKREEDLKPLQARIIALTTEIKESVSMASAMERCDIWKEIHRRLGITKHETKKLLMLLQAKRNEATKKIKEMAVDLGKLKNLKVLPYDPSVLLGKRVALEQQLEKTEKARERIERALKRLEPLVKFFAPEGMALAAMKAMVPTLNSYVASMTERLDTHVNVRFTEVEMRGGKHGVDMLVDIRSVEQKIELCSPGERTMVDIIVRSAILSLLGISKVLVADELTERLSGDVKMQIINAITTLVEQVIIITHDDITLGFDVVEIS